MSERLLAKLVADRLGDAAEKYVHSESVGTSAWHVGEAMYPSALRELTRRGAVEAGFRARQMTGGHLDTADLILTATGDQLAAVEDRRPDAAPRAFVLGEFGRLVTGVDSARLPKVGPELDPDKVWRRGVAIVTAADQLRGGRPAAPGDDLDDPWGSSQAVFSHTADRIEAAFRPFVDLLLSD
jgi:protein-tyrosine phosphatase